MALVNFLGQLFSPTSDFNPGIFDDDVAYQTQWTPLISGGANYKTYSLKLRNDRRIDFVSTSGHLIFCALFMLIGSAILLVFLFEVFEYGDLGSGMWLLAFAGFMFFGGGFAMYWFGTVPAHFDKDIGLFWKSRLSPEKVTQQTDVSLFTPLSEIHALQVIPERISGNRKYYYSYEINLVLKNGRRLNVVDHGNLKSIEKDVAALSDFLEVPIWSLV